MAGSSKRVAILGASGYTGAELIRLLAAHPAVEVVLLTADRHAGRPVAEVFPHLGRLELPDLMALDEVEWAGVDLDFVFCALPHGHSQEIVRGLFHATGHSLVDELIIERAGDLVAAIPEEVRVIDLAADFRLADPAVYADWYGAEHQAPELQKAAVYGLSEWARDDIAKASLVACPGCYPTATLLALAPLVAAGLIELDGIVIDAKSGVSGAGRGLNQASLFSEAAEGLHAYGLAGHRHLPEIEQLLGNAAERDVNVTFTPHLVPMNRGILASLYVRLAAGASADDLRAALTRQYRSAPFVHVLGAGQSPDTRHVRGTNHALLSVFEDRVPGRAIVLSVIDNLVKGAAGQAVQNMNIMLGLPETEGLEASPLYP